LRRKRRKKNEKKREEVAGIGIEKRRDISVSL
jgi:hypothetical protein